MIKEKKAENSEKETENSEKKAEVIVEEQTLSQKELANKTILTHVLSSMGVGLIPIPVIDLVGISGVQLNLVRKLANIYEVPYTRDRIKNILTPLVGGAVPVMSATTIFSLFKAIPVIGQTTGALAISLTAGAVTYAVGKVFLQHFASGGTFLSFDPDEVREYYEAMVKEGRNVAADLKTGK